MQTETGPEHAAAVSDSRRNADADTPCKHGTPMKVLSYGTGQTRQPGRGSVIMNEYPPLRTCRIFPCKKACWQPGRAGPPSCYTLGMLRHVLAAAAIGAALGVIAAAVIVMAWAFSDACEIVIFGENTRIMLCRGCGVGLRLWPPPPARIHNAPAEPATPTPQMGRVAAGDAKPFDTRPPGPNIDSTRFLSITHHCSYR